MAFLSEARDIAPGPASGFQEVFVRDQLTGVMKRITVGLAGEPPYGGYSDPPGFSADGRYVVFPSSAANLVPNDTEGTSDNFVRDRTTQQTVRVNVRADGTPLPYCDYPAISADGRYVSFQCYLNLGVDGNEVGDIFVKGLHLVEAQSNRITQSSVRSRRDLCLSQASSFH